MTKRLNSKHKVDRRLKVNLWGRPKSPFNTRAYGPGQHGQTKTSKPSDYGIQLQAKQKLKAYYGNINERQFRNIYKKAVMLKGDTGENLIGLLERRLDAVIYRAKFATTIFSARQLINHGHVKVNGKKVKTFAELRGKIGSIGAGKNVKLTIVRRDGKDKVVTVKLKRNQNENISAVNIHRMLEGAELKNNTEDDGVDIINVTKGSPAQQIGLKTGDIISGINRQRINNLAELRNALKEQKGVFALNIIRGNHNLYLMIR